MQYDFIRVKKKVYCLNIFTFDIETSSVYIENNKVKNYNEVEDIEKCEKASLMYNWQVAQCQCDSVDDYKYSCGRDYTSLLSFLKNLSEEVNKQKNDINVKENVHIIVYVHNLAFEFQFLRNLFKYFKNVKVFAREKRQPIYLKFTYQKTIYEFRCSLILTQKSLRQWCIDEDLKIKKLEEKIDYLKIRTPLTTLTEQEKMYNKLDVVSMLYGIKKYVDKYGSINNIPYTQTGCVRRRLKEVVAQEYLTKVKKTTESYTFNQFSKLIFAYTGGWTHTNAIYFNQLLTNVKCYDFTSSYPTRMLLNKFPQSDFKKISLDVFDKYQDEDKYSYLITFEVWGVLTLKKNTFYPKSKCVDFDNVQEDNGKIYSADYMKICCTNLDYKIFNSFYVYEKINILEVEVCENEHLNINIINLILELYNNKTLLKNIEEKESLYNESKQFINSLYGVAVTRTITDDVVFVGDEWRLDELTAENFDARKEKILKSDIYLPFAVGVWVSAYARYELFTLINELDERVVYGDTDSLKGVFTVEDLKTIEKYNFNLLEKVKKTAEKLNLDYELYRPKNKLIGLFTPEPTYVKAKFLGAKRYCYDLGDGVPHFTIAGLPKNAGVNVVGEVEDFVPGLKWDEKQSLKNTRTYLDDQPAFKIEGVEYTEKYGITITPTTFDLSIGETYEDFIYKLSTISGKYTLKNCHKELLKNKKMV